MEGTKVENCVRDLLTPIMRMLLLVLTLAISAAASAATGEPRVLKGKKFAHPGIFYTEGDFGRMKAMIAAGARLRAIVVGK